MDLLKYREVDILKYSNVNKLKYRNVNKLLNNAKIGIRKYRYNMIEIENNAAKI